MAATGYGNDTQSAINDARAELSRIISVHIRDEFEMTEKSLRITDNKNVRNEYERYVTSKTSAVTDNDLFATTVAGNWYDRERKTRAALVVLERSVAGSRYASQIKSAVEQSTLLFRQAAARLDEGRHAAALQNTIDALRQMQEAIRMQLIAMIVCPGRVTLRTMIDPEFVAAIKDSLRAQLADIHLEKVSGDNQKVYPGRTPQRVAVRAVTADERKPISGLPIAFTQGRGSDLHDETATTDADGKVQFRVEKPEAGIASHGMVARVNTGAGLPGIAPPSQLFTIFMPTVSNTWVAVFIENAAASDAMQEAFSKGDFQLLDRAKVAALAKEHKISSDTKDAELLKAFAPGDLDIAQDGFLFIVTGSAKPGQVKTMKTDSGSLHIASAAYSFKLLDANSAEVIHVSTGEATEGDPEDKETAVRRVHEVAARQACGDLLRSLRKRLAIDDE